MLLSIQPAESPAIEPIAPTLQANAPSHENRLVRSENPSRAHNLTPAPLDVLADAAGRGRVAVELVAGRSVVTRCRANSPLRILTPRVDAASAWVFCGTYGGGFVDGDQIGLTLDVGANARCLLGAQASTKVYRAVSAGCRQTLNITAGVGSLVAVLPDTLVCFAGARYSQRQSIRLGAGASLVLAEVLSAGRVARGERWAFDHYESRTDIFLENRQIFRDAVILRPGRTGVGDACRTGGFDCLATAVIIGDRVAVQSQSIVRALSAAPAGIVDGVLFSVAALAPGVLIRAAGINVETLVGWLRRQLAFVPELLGQDPWRRKW